MVHMKDFIPKRNRSTQRQNRVLLEMRDSTFQLIQLIPCVDFCVIQWAVLMKSRSLMGKKKTVGISFWNE